jgi:hypothetical protein
VLRYNRRRNLALAFRTLLGYDNGAQDQPKIIYTPSAKERRRAKKEAAAVPPGA